MSVPTVASLSASLGQDLHPASDRPLPDTPISAVHISELLDPSPYLAGGELLLTLGIALPQNKMGCRRYVTALRRSGVSAVVIGLGPVHTEVPEHFAQACAEGGVPLLVVPIRTPFLTVTKAYWSAVARSTERHLSDAISAHRALVEAAVSPEPVSAVLKRLASWLGGWAAVLDGSGTVIHIHPVGSRQAAEQLQDDVRRLEVAGVNSSASYSADGRTVVLFPLAVGTRIAGCLAVGTESRLDASQRAVVLAACGLLSLDASRSAGSASAGEARRQDVLDLVVDGYVGAADRLASRAGLGPLPRECRVLTLEGRDTEALGAVVRRWSDRAVGAGADRRSCWFVVASDEPDLAGLATALTRADATVRALVSDRVRIEDVGAVRARQAEEVGRLAPGSVVVPVAPAAEDDLARRIDALEDAGRPVVQALAAYLRAHGQWEPAARSLDLHRNTLRYRVERARMVLDLDLADVEVTSRLWLAMRARGLT